jgi:hypothetical protein
LALLVFSDLLANATVRSDGLEGGHEKCAGHSVEYAEGWAGGSAKSYRVVGSITLNWHWRRIANRHSFQGRVNSD